MKKRDEDKLEGMTTNERLWETDLLSEFEDAQRSRDYDRIREILRSIHVDQPSIERIVDQTRNSDAWNETNRISDQS